MYNIVMNEVVNIIGAGLSGVEAALQLAKRKIKVHLYEAKPLEKSDAHKSDMFAELVCSNSFRSDDKKNAVGLLKEEMRLLDSFILKAADLTKIEGGVSLQVDRDKFSFLLTKWVKESSYITVINKTVTKIPEGLTLIATGPLTIKLNREIEKLVGMKNLYFYDAVAPIITKESIDFKKVYFKSRYDRGEASYINCPFSEKEFLVFYENLITAKKTDSKEELKLFSGCMAIEEIARLGKRTLLFGPMKPVGLEWENKRPFAVAQLRQDDAEKNLYNLVGFQTSLKFFEQKRVFRLIPGLENAEFVRYGKMHRNTYLGKSGLLNHNYQLIKNKNIYFIGQISGVEGYIESASTGIVAAINLWQTLIGKGPVDFTKKTCIGALGHYVATENKSFAPMNVNYGIITEPNIKKRNLRRMKICEDSLKIIKEIIDERQI